jgi:PTS system mannitol-specific IIC component
MQLYLLPTLIAFNAGRLVHNTRGGVIATLVVFGVIVGNQFNPGFIDGSNAAPQFLAAMMVGPIAAGVLKGFDKLVEGKIKAGFEMLVNNFSLGIIGAILAVGAFYGMPYVFNAISYALMEVVKFLINNKLMFLAALIVEPAKILFLNNAINHGVFTPLGVTMVSETGKSILFLLEANPGPGLGILLATIIFDKKTRGNAAGASIIHFFGGIHEVYFPFVLMRFQMILALLAGGLVGDAVFQIFDVGLRASASPGSVIAIFAQAESSASNYAWLAVGIVLSMVASLGIGSLIFLLNRKRFKNQDSSDELQKAATKTQVLKGKKSAVISKNINPEKKSSKEAAKLTLTKLPELIIFACEAGMGSSAMGASLLRNKLKKANLAVEVKNYAIKNLPDDAKFVITQKALTELAKNKVPTAIHRSIDNFLDNNFYEKLITELKEFNQVKKVKEIK